MTDKPPSVPLYQRVFGILSQRIRDGEYSEGQQLPSIDALCEEFGASRGTIRQAVGELVARDLVVRKQGRGTYISERGEREAKAASASSFTDLIMFTRDLASRDVALDRSAPIPLRIRRLLATDKTHGTVIRRTREVDGRIFAYTVQYLAPDVDDLFDSDTWREIGLLTLLHNRGVVLSSADQSMAARVADVDVADRLDIDLGAPVLYAERILHSENGPVEVFCAWYRGDLFRWETKLAIEQAADRIVISASTDVNLQAGRDDSNPARSAGQGADTTRDQSSVGVGGA